MFVKFMPQEERLLSSAKLQILHFIEKKSNLMKILKIKCPNIKPCRMSLRASLQALKLESILILCV